MWKLVKEQRAAGEIRKMVAMDGHRGRRRSTSSRSFSTGCRTRSSNGGGALFDFGCYGANLMTWMMDNQRPLAVTAVTQQFQPDVYAKVDDEATILVEYPKAQGIIQASWNWPFDRKDFEVYGERGLAIATGGTACACPAEGARARRHARAAPCRREGLDLAPDSGRARHAQAERPVVAREQHDRHRNPRGGARVGADARESGAETEIAAMAMSSPSGSPRRITAIAGRDADRDSRRTLLHESSCLLLQLDGHAALAKRRVNSAGAGLIRGRMRIRLRSAC